MGELNIVHIKIRIRARTYKLNTLLVAVTGFRQYSAVEDLRLNTFAHGQEIGLPQLAIQETTFSRLEPGYGHITIPTTGCALLLVEVNTPHIQGRALGATHGGSIAIRQRQEPLALFFHRMNQYQTTATHETYDDYLVSLQRLDAYREGTAASDCNTAIGPMPSGARIQPDTEFCFTAYNSKATRVNVLEAHIAYAVEIQYTASPIIMGFVLVKH